MFLLQLQLYVLTITRVTLRRIQKPFRRKSTFCKFCKYTILSKLRVQRKSVLQALYSDCSEWAIYWSIVLARIDFVSLYFRLLWYHSILRGSIDQKHAKKRHLRTKQWNPLCFRLFPLALHDFQIFPDGTAHAWSVEGRNICSVSVFIVRVVSQISPRRAKKDSNIPSPGRTRSVKCPTPGPTKTIKSPPHALSPHQEFTVKPGQAFPSLTN